MIADVAYFAETVRRLGAGILTDAQLDAVIARALAVGKCRGCGEDLDTADRARGLHPACLDPNLSTVDLVGEALRRYDANSQRTRQTAVGPSEIGVECDRRIGYKLHNLPAARNGGVPWAPLQGTAMHALIADALHQVNTALGRERFLIERQVLVAAGITGNCDVYDMDTCKVTDWKYVGDWSLKKYRREGPGPAYRVQAHLYGRGWANAGMDVEWVSVVYLPRAATMDAAFEWSEPFDRQIAQAAIDRLYRINDLIGEAGLDVANHPELWAAVPAAPGDACTFCPWLRLGGSADATGCPGAIDTTNQLKGIIA